MTSYIACLRASGVRGSSHASPEHVSSAVALKTSGKSALRYEEQCLAAQRKAKAAGSENLPHGLKTPIDCRNQPFRGILKNRFGTPQACCFQHSVGRKGQAMEMSRSCFLDFSRVGHSSHAFCGANNCIVRVVKPKLWCKSIDFGRDIQLSCLLDWIAAFR